MNQLSGFFDYIILVDYFQSKGGGRTKCFFLGPEHCAMLYEGHRDQHNHVM